MGKTLRSAAMPDQRGAADVVRLQTTARRLPRRFWSVRRSHGGCKALAAMYTDTSAAPESASTRSTKGGSEYVQTRTSKRAGDAGDVLRLQSVSKWRERAWRKWC